MKRVGLMLGLLVVSLAALSGAREMKANLIGVWIVDEDATIDYYKEKTRETDRRKLEKNIRNLKAFINSANLQFRFAPELVHVTNRGETESYSYNIERAAGQTMVLKTGKTNVASHTKVEMRIYFRNEKEIVITSSEAKDLDIYIWKKLPPRAVPPR